MEFAFLPVDHRTENTRPAGMLQLLNQRANL